MKPEIRKAIELLMQSSGEDFNKGEGVALVFVNSDGVASAHKGQYLGGQVPALAKALADLASKLLGLMLPRTEALEVDRSKRKDEGGEN